MKKVFPSIIISFVFGVLVILQMVIHGQKITATGLSETASKYASFESQLTKLSGSTTKGTELDISKIEEPVIIVNFWASWCKPCLSEFSSLKKLMETYPKGVRVIGINNDTEDQMKLIEKTENKYKLPFESIADAEGEIAENFNITRVPASIIYHKGKVIYFSNKETDFMANDLRVLVASKVVKN